MRIDHLCGSRRSKIHRRNNCQNKSCYLNTWKKRRWDEEDFGVEEANARTGAPVPRVMRIIGPSPRKCECKKQLLSGDWRTAVTGGKRGEGGTDAQSAHP